MVEITVRIYLTLPVARGRSRTIHLPPGHNQTSELPDLIASPRAKARRTGEAIVHPTWVDSQILAACRGRREPICRWLRFFPLRCGD
jgi:hypothetical protein